MAGTSKDAPVTLRAPHAIGSRIKENLAAAQRARRSGDAMSCWRLLEDAHVLSQPWPLPHVGAHWAMFTAAVALREWNETPGQVVRLVAAGPASVLNRYPRGNTGRSAVPATQPMPIRPDLAALLKTALHDEERRPQRNKRDR